MTEIIRRILESKPTGTYHITGVDGIDRATDFVKYLSDQITSYPDTCGTIALTFDPVEIFFPEDNVPEGLRVIDSQRRHSPPTIRNTRHSSTFEGMGIEVDKAFREMSEYKRQISVLGCLDGLCKYLSFDRKDEATGKVETDFSVAQQAVRYFMNDAAKDRRNAAVTFSSSNLENSVANTLTQLEAEVIHLDELIPSGLVK